MKRLTKYESIGGHAHAIPMTTDDQKIVSRLAAFEDTDLTPEEFAAYWAFIQDLIGGQKASEALSHLRELAEADKDGRVVVTRCKDCKHKGWVQEPCHGKSVDYCKVWDCTLRNLEATFCSYGKPKEGNND